jgi:predicted amidohydrolase
MPDTTVQLALGQMLVEPGHPEANLQRAERMIRQAAQTGCVIVVLPECLDLGWTHPSAHKLAKPIPGRFSDQLCHAASANGIHVVAGLTERADGRIYNAAVLIDPCGEILLVHRKINLLEGLEEHYTIGNRLGVAETGIGTIGITICADNFSDSLALGHSLARMGAHAILSPCAWAVPADHDNHQEPYGDLWKTAYVRLAELYEISIIGVNNVGRVAEGPWKGHRCIGCSLAVGRDGQILLQGPYGKSAQALLTVPLELRPQLQTGTAIAPMLRRKGYDRP